MHWWTDRQVEDEGTDEPVDGWMDGYVDECMHRWKEDDTWMYERKEINK